ncbi:hypothetical protein J3U57_05440 [Gilliamella sp. B3464]|uniref:hypothetical protein n=1 Tax=unclassified Gilliamella TaxID=2685620 RepID=UPI00226A4232|nr:MULTISPECIES: hypothetical protein [unclassified Gilliamella]MCX8713135.1 hypothetical protein [Gilliamella sp. B3468]MCX8751010.1 hypothetical protein [Gilliamella sp. B3464]
MEVKIIRNLVVVLLMFWLASCSHTRTYEEAYNEGYYLQSINILALNIEQKGIAKFKQEDAEHLRNLVNRVMVKYEADLADSAANDYEDKISTYNKLMEMHDRLSNQFYSNELTFFLNAYSRLDINENLFKCYVIKANSIVATDIEGYKAKVDLYHNALELKPSRDVQKLYDINNNKYIMLVIENLYQKAKEYADYHNYEDARKTLEQAKKLYYSVKIKKYKDIDKLIDDYWDKEQALFERQLIREQQEKEQKRIANRDKTKVYCADTQCENAVNYATHYSSDIVFVRNESEADAKVSFQKQTDGTLNVYCDTDRCKEKVKREVRNNNVNFVRYENEADVTIKDKKY